MDRLPVPIEIIYFSPDLREQRIILGEGVIQSDPVCGSMGIGVCYDLDGSISPKEFVSSCVARIVIKTGRPVESTQVYTEPQTGILRNLKRYGFPSHDGGCYEVRFEFNDYLTHKQTRDTNMNDNFRLIASGINHELRSPLQAIAMYSEMIFSDGNLGQESKEMAGLIRGEISTISGILDSLGKFNQLNKSVRDYCSMGEVIQQTWKTLSMALLPGHPKVMEVDFDYDERLSNVYPNIPRSEMQQVLTNIFRNSIESFDKKNGEIEVKLLLLSGDFFSFSIRDNGCGIPTKYLPKIFVPFVTSKDGGQGLGLTICRNFLSQRGGTIVVLSQEKEYTEVVISLPVRRDNEELGKEIS